MPRMNQCSVFAATSLGRLPHIEGARQTFSPAFQYFFVLVVPSQSARTFATKSSLAKFASLRKTFLHRTRHTLGNLKFQFSQRWHSTATRRKIRSVLDRIRDDGAIVDLYLDDYN